MECDLAEAPYTVALKPPGLLHGLDYPLDGLALPVVGFPPGTAPANLPE